jgi:hypothetical protein
MWYFYQPVDVLIAGQLERHSSINMQVISWYRLGYAKDVCKPGKNSGSWFLSGKHASWKLHNARNRSARFFHDNTTCDGTDWLTP